MQVTELRTMGYMEMMEAFEKMINDCRFEASPDEHEELLRERLRRTLDKAPPLYAFFQVAESYLAYWVDMAAKMEGTTSERYKDLKNKRDSAERLGQAVKLFYESASRRMTLLMEGADHRR